MSLLGSVLPQPLVIWPVPVTSGHPEVPPSGSPAATTGESSSGLGSGAGPQALASHATWDWACQPRGPAAPDSVPGEWLRDLTMGPTLVPGAGWPGDMTGGGGGGGRWETEALCALSQGSGGASQAPGHRDSFRSCLSSIGVEGGRRLREHGPRALRLLVGGAGPHGRHQTREEARIGH